MFAYMRGGPNFYKGGRCSGRAYHPPGYDHQHPEHGRTPLWWGCWGRSRWAAVSPSQYSTVCSAAFYFGVQSGSTVLLSQYWGKQDMESINRIYGMALWLVMQYRLCARSFC